MPKLFDQADAFLRECFAACQRDSVPIDDAVQAMVIADAHRKLSDRLFRPDRIGERGGPVDASRDDRIHFVAAHTVWEMGLRPPLEAFTRLMQAKPTASEPALA